MGTRPTTATINKRRVSLYRNRAITFEHSYRVLLIEYWQVKAKAEQMEKSYIWASKKLKELGKAGHGPFADIAVYKKIEPSQP